MAGGHRAFGVGSGTEGGEVVLGIEMKGNLTMAAEREMGEGSE